jgi:hypothetical protein
MQESRRAANLEGPLLLRAEPLGLAERICRRTVGEIRVVDGALWLEADPAWSGALNTVLVKKGVRVSELRPSAHDAAYASLKR